MEHSMSPAILSAAAMFGFVTSITPGPNNMMLLASGLNFGVRRTLPHMLGISIGYVILMLAVGFGLGEVLRAVPGAFLALKLAGGAYMLWLAWQIARSAPPREEAKGQAARRGIARLPPHDLPWRRGVPMGQPQGLGDRGDGGRDLCGAERSRARPRDRDRRLRPHQPAVDRRLGHFRRELAAAASRPDRLRRFNVTMAALLVVSLWPLFAAAP